MPLFRRGVPIEGTRGASVDATMETVQSVASRPGAGLQGAKVTIVHDPDLVGPGVYGHTPDAGNITLYPDAFTNAETLTVTLGHEANHVYAKRLRHEGNGRRPPRPQAQTGRAASSRTLPTARDSVEPRGRTTADLRLCGRTALGLTRPHQRLTAQGRPSGRSGWTVVPRAHGGARPATDLLARSAPPDR